MKFIFCYLSTGLLFLNFIANEERNEPAEEWGRSKRQNILANFTDQVGIKPNIKKIADHLDVYMVGNKYRYNIRNFTNYLADNLRSDPIFDAVQQDSKVNIIGLLEPVLFEGMVYVFSGTDLSQEQLERFFKALLYRVTFSEMIDDLTQGSPNRTFTQALEAVHDAFTIPREKKFSLKVTQIERNVEDLIERGRKAFEGKGMFPAFLINSLKLLLGQN